MHEFRFVPEPENLPGVASPERAAAGIERWRDAARGSGDAGLSTFADRIIADTGGRRLLEAMFGNSPFLSQCAANDPGLLRDIVAGGPDAVFARVMEGLEAARGELHDDTGLARLLRVARRRTAVAVAVADIADFWPLERITGALSDLADSVLGIATAYLLRKSAEAGAFHLADADAPERTSGLVVLGMGKLGARELNFSSDVDLIVLYDPERIETADPSGLQNHFVRLTRQLVNLLEERTADGYVFRTDLRLRPDPGSTPLALSVIAAETYYESLGQNWERAAMIKARPVAGDTDAGAAFLNRLTPYIWRKNLDFAAIQDIHSIKRQIDAHRGGGRIAIPGHNVKLGRGGIREIEFFVQTQQLIWGGRERRLRRASTVDALAELAAAGRVNRETTDDLIAAYRVLRRVEHRLQMVDDKQTHSLPETDQGLNEMALFLGYRDAEAMSTDLLGTLRTVESHYAELFEDAPALGAQGRVTGNLVFTGGDADPETIRTIERLGYGKPEAVDRAIRGWHHGRYRAMRSTRARELLTELVPVILAAFAKAPHPDDSFIRFDGFLSRLPAGVQLFSMFYSNPHLLGLVAEIIGKAPRLAQHMSRRPSILDSMLTRGFFDPPPALASLNADLGELLAQAATIEDVLDICRRWANDCRVQVGVQRLREAIDPRAAGVALSNIAEAALTQLLPRVEEEFSHQNGRIAGSGMVIVALGKLGGREMTPASDLDLILVYDVPEDAGESDGPRPLPPAHYFARLSQRLISAVTVQTSEGNLYEIDMRLRPSGHAGPIASSVEAWVRYHDESSWTWEQMALTRARVIAGPDDLRKRVETLIRGALIRRRGPDTLLADMAEMRLRTDKEHHTNAIWEVKHLRGGLVDVEFIAQYLQLLHAHAHPEVLSPNTRTALARIRDAGLLDASVADRLIAALELWQGVQAMLRLTVEGTFGMEMEDEVPESLQDDLAKVGAAANIAALKEKMRAVAAAVRSDFVDLIETPAKAIGTARQMRAEGR